MLEMRNCFYINTENIVKNGCRSFRYVRAVCILKQFRELYPASMLDRVVMQIFEKRYTLGYSLSA